MYKFLSKCILVKLYREPNRTTLLCKDCKCLRPQLQLQLLWPENVLLVKLDLSLLTPKSCSLCVATHYVYSTYICLYVCVYYISLVCALQFWQSSSQSSSQKVKKGYHHEITALFACLSLFCMAPPRCLTLLPEALD